MNEEFHEVSAPIPVRKSDIFTRKNLFLFALFILIGLAWLLKRYYVVATVNGQPIPRWDLSNQLNQRYGEQTLDDMINERLLISAIHQKGIYITDAEINQRIKDVEKQLNGKISLQEALKSQGTTMEEFRRQMEIRLAIEKMFDKEATVSSSEVDEYIKNNSDQLKTATDQAQLRKDVEANLKQQKINDLFQKWFDDVKKGAKIQKYQ